MPSLLKIPCTACGAPIYRERGRVNENLKLKHNFYCSRACEYAHKTRRRIIQCDNPDCGKEFSRMPNDVFSHNYCSRSCAAHINNQKFPKRGLGFKLCGYVSCNKRFIGGMKYCSHACYSASRKRHGLKELIGELQQVSSALGRVPAKREVKPLADACIHAFGSWNNAIIAAGLAPNRSDSQRMYHRTQTVAKDGHKCDSVSEALIDNWFTDHEIEHARDASYPATQHKADWKIGQAFVEYFGLAEDSPRYDRAVRRKRNLCRKYKIPLVEIYPKDIYPNIILENKMGSFAGKSS